MANQYLRTPENILTAEEANLKPCPFCGSDNIMAAVNPIHNTSVFCRGCGTATKSFATAKEAIDLWNTRKELP